MPLFKAKTFVLAACFLALAVIIGAPGLSWAQTFVVGPSDPGFKILAGSKLSNLSPAYTYAPKALLGSNLFATSDDNPPLTVFAWYFTKLPTGRYKVFSSWLPQSDLTTDALYMIQTSKGRQGRFIDQTKPPSLGINSKAWEELATVDVLFDGLLDVKLTNKFKFGSRVIADSIRLERVSALPTDSDTVQAYSPWASITSNGNATYSTFNSRFDLSSGPLPSLIVNGSEIPRPSLTIQQNGTQTLVNSPTNLDLLKPDRAHFHGKMPLVGGELHWRAELEFDNFYKVVISIVPDSFSTPMLIEGFKFNWALPDSEVKIAASPGFGGNTFASDNETTLIPFVKKQTNNWATYFGQSTASGRNQPPSLWIGNTKKGISWQAESDEDFSYDHWTSSSAGFAKLLSLVRTGSPSLVSMNVDIIKGPFIKLSGGNVVQTPAISVDRPLRYVFSIQPTPVRPENNQLRGFITGSYATKSSDPVSQRGSNIFLFGGQYFNTDKGSSIPSDSSVSLDPLKSHISWYPGGLFSYTGAWWVHPSLGLKNENWWAVEARNLNGTATVPEYDKTLYSAESELLVSPSSKSWRDFFLADAKRVLNYPFVAGIYVDLNHISKSSNRANSDFLVDNWGRSIYSNWQVFAHRSMMTELYRLHLADASTGQPEKKLFIHQHNDEVAAVHSWGHLSFPGEDSYFKIRVHPSSYTSEVQTISKSGKEFIVGYPLEYWQSLKRMGNYPIFLNQFARANSDLINDGLPSPNIDPNNISLLRGLISMLGLHDIGLHGTWLSGEPSKQAHDLALGYNLLMQKWRGATFYPYWEQNRFPSKLQDLLISYYEKQDSSLLIWITNRSSSPITTTINATAVTIPPKDYIFLEDKDKVAPGAPPSLSIQ